MKKSKKWWLISDEDVQIIRDGLTAPTHDINDYNCPTGWDDCRGCDGDEKRRNALHALDSGLYLTNAIPDDWKEATDE
jgi:hypothetical protein